MHIFHGDNLRLAAFVAALLLIIPANAQETTLAADGQVISFTENKGQVGDQNGNPRPDVLYSGTDGNLTFHLKNNGISYQQTRVDSWKEPTDLKFYHKNAGVPQIPDQTTLYRVDVNWLNANANSTIVRGVEESGVDNYYSAVCSNGVLDVKSYGSITYGGVYSGIDLKWYSKDNQLKYDYVVAPGADYKQIQLRYDGAESIAINAKGELVIKTPLGDLIEQAPLVLQNGKTLPSRWIINNNTVSFSIDNIDVSKEFIIDPAVRVWGTFYGGTQWEFGYSTTVDAAGNSFMTGYTVSTGAIATVGAHQTTFGSGAHDAFLVKFNSSGVRQWGTYYGGAGDDIGYYCTKDPSGNIFMVGTTASSAGISTAGSHQATFGGANDVFLVKFNTSGVRQWATYYGSGTFDNGYSCATDASGNVFITGYTESSTTISTAGSHQATYGTNGDAFLVKFNSAGVRQWGTFYGGTGYDYANSCITDPSGNVFIAGRSESSSAIVSAGAHQTTNSGAGDAYLAKFNTSGVRQWATYYGGAANDEGYSCATDAAGNIYMTGVTASNSSIATVGSQEPTYNFGDESYLVKFNPAGVRQWATYVAGYGTEFGYTCTVDPGGKIYVGGSTSSGSSFTTSFVHQTIYGGGTNDAFLGRYDASGIKEWMTYYGGTTNDIIYCCATDLTDKVFFSGVSSSGSLMITTSGAHQTAMSGAYDAMLVKMQNTPGEALLFDGVANMVLLGPAPALDITGDMTLETWIYPYTNASGTFFYNGAANAYPGFSMDLYGNILQVDINNGLTVLHIMNTVSINNAWHHVAFTRVEATGLITVYLDGVALPNTGTLAGPLGINSIDATLGGRGTAFFNGYMDETRVWNRALCQAEIQNNMNCEIATTAPGLVLNYHYNSGDAWGQNASFTTLVDATGGGTNGTLSTFVLSGTASNWVAPGAVTTGVSCSTFNPPAVSVTSAGQTNITCNSAATGAASVNATGSGLIYNWTPGNPAGDGTSSVTGLTAGTWTCTVTNSCGGTGTYTFNITQPSALVVAATSQTNANCSNAGGAATVSASGGTAGYTYNWNPGNPTGDGTASVSNLSAGTWSCTVTDGNGCTATQTFNITQPGGMTLSTFAQTNVSCNGGANGAASITVTGGTPNFNYNWTPGNPTGDGTASVSGLTAGTWTCTVTDGAGCISTQTVNITQPPLLLSSIVSQVNINCNGGNNGAASITVNGGSAPYAYNWTPGNPAGDGTSSVTSLTAGTWTCTVTDAQSCSTSQTFNITQPAVLAPTVSATTIQCNGGTSVVTVNGVGGTAPYTGTGTFTVSAGTYSYPVTDAHGCSATVSVTITQPAVLNTSVTSLTNPTSCGGSDGVINITVSGGSPAYSYLWSNGATTQDLTAGAGSYSCVITDAHGCTSTASGSLNDPNAPIVTFTSSVDSACQGITSPFTLTGGSPAGGSYSGPGVSGNVFDPAMANLGVNIISYTYTNISGCTGSAADSIQVDICMNVFNIDSGIEAFTIAPNPNSGEFQLMTNLTEEFEVGIYDGLGQLVSQSTFAGGVQPILSIRESGVYLIAVQTADGRKIVSRVVVCK